MCDRSPQVEPLNSLITYPSLWPNIGNFSGQGTEYMDCDCAWNDELHNST